MGHVLTPEGLAPDPEKIRAILEMQKPTDAATVQRLLGMATYLSKFHPRLSSVVEPLQRFTDKSTKDSFVWDTQHENAFMALKGLMSVAPVLGYYDVHKEVTIESDSSNVGLGTLISQEGKPIAYASRALTTTERNYAQIENECLLIVFATERLDQYILG